MYDIRDDKKLLLTVVKIIKDECPNNNKGGLCNKPAGNCIDCWQNYLKNELGEPVVDVINLNKQNKYIENAAFCGECGTQLIKQYPQMTTCEEWYCPKCSKVVHNITFITPQIR